ELPGPLTLPEPEGVAHAPSPRQNVVDDAPVPLFKWETDRFPVTPVARGNPVALVNVTLAGVPSAGAVNVCVPPHECAVEKTSEFSIADVTFVAPMVVALPTLVTSPVRFALV